MMSSQFLLISFLGHYAQLSSAYWACKEPAVCECVTGCEVYMTTNRPERKYTCEKPLNIWAVQQNEVMAAAAPTYWGPRIVQQQITWAKEKLAAEGAKTYESPWKEHVLGGKTMEVIGLQYLLGATINTMKAAYTTAITHRAAVAGPTRKCEFAKCIAFCMGKCEGQCDELLEKTDEAALEGIMWTKTMCDVDGSKELMKAQCNGFKAEAEGCDANCDGAETKQVVYPMIFSGLILSLFQ